MQDYDSKINKFLGIVRSMDHKVNRGKLAILIKVSAYAQATCK